KLGSSVSFWLADGCRGGIGFGRVIFGWRLGGGDWTSGDEERLGSSVSFSVWEESEALEGLVEETLGAGAVAGEGKGLTHQGEGVVCVWAEGFDFGLSEEAKLKDGGGEIEAEALFGWVLGED